MKLSTRLPQGRPFFSVCIPQYNRTSFLLKALEVLKGQTFQDFEVCISDDNSPDGRQEEVVSFLNEAGLSYSFKHQDTNLRYDANLRASMALARGKYCLLHGNDDCLSSPTALEELYAEIEAYGSPDVVITNFKDWQSGLITRRVQHTGIIGAGPLIAAAHFRDVAFVTGVIFDRDKAQAIATERWDGSEMYQMWVAARLIANSGKLLMLEKAYVSKDILLEGEIVDSYARKQVLNPCPIIPRHMTFGKIGMLVNDAIGPFLKDTDRRTLVEKVYLQLYMFTYPYWIFEYRRVQSWRYSAGICLGLSPHFVVGAPQLGILRTIRLYTVYALICTLGLCVPLTLFDACRPVLYKLAKSCIRS